MGSQFFHKFRDKVKRQKEVLTNLVNRTDTVGVELYFSEKVKLQELFLHEESYWKQRAKNYWLAEGDANTKFFHASASARRRTNHIAFLEDDQGNQVHEHGEMCRIVADYFTEVFKNTRSDNVNLDLVTDRRVTDNQNAKLVADITYEEFTVVAKQMHPDKASGPDGLNPAFFQQFWPILGREVYTCCEQFLDTISFPVNLNDTNVVLIPKKEKSSYMKDLRPMVCVTCSTKF